MHMAEARMKKTKEELQVIKEKQKEDEEHDFKFLRDKVAKVVGSKDAAECVVKEAIIHEVNEDAQDGINVFKSGGILVTVACDGVQDFCLWVFKQC